MASIQLSWPFVGTPRSILWSKALRARDKEVFSKLLDLYRRKGLRSSDPDHVIAARLEVAESTWKACLAKLRRLGFVRVLTGVKDGLGRVLRRVLLIQPVASTAAEDTSPEAAARGAEILAPEGPENRPLDACPLNNPPNRSNQEDDDKRPESSSSFAPLTGEEAAIPEASPGLVADAQALLGPTGRELIEEKLREIRNPRPVQQAVDATAAAVRKGTRIGSLVAYFQGSLKRIVKEHGPAGKPPEATAVTHADRERQARLARLAAPPEPEPPPAEEDVEALRRYAAAPGHPLHRYAAKRLEELQLL